jgi:hypothetical protein
MRMKKHSAVITWYPFVFLALAILAAALHVYLFRTGLVETLLLYLLVVKVGLNGIWAFLGHYFRSDKTAEFIGWPAGNPFQKEVAFANLGYGVAGVLSIWLRGGYWLALILAYSVFSLGAAWVHYSEIRKSKNYAPGNAGPAFYADILVPVLLLALLALHCGLI